MNLTPLTAHVGSSTDPGDTVVEFGCGDGRNLIYLQRALPDGDFVELEPSEVSCALARRLAERFDADVTIHEADVTAELPAALPARSAALAYSCHALEQMPRIFGRALANMAVVSRNAIALFEPVPELWPWNRRGVVSRLRVGAIDRMRGLTGAAARLAGGGEWTIETARRLGYASTRSTRPARSSFAAARSRQPDRRPRAVRWDRRHARDRDGHPVAHRGRTR